MFNLNQSDNETNITKQTSFRDWYDTIQLCDCVEGMSSLPDKSFDICIADPPYNLAKGNIWKWDNSIELQGFGGNWSKFMASWDNISLEDYVFFTVKWLSEVKRLVKPSGSLWVHGTYHNIGIVNFVMQLLEIEIINEVVWYKRNSFPNLAGRRLTASHETIIWAHTGKKREYYFDYETAKNMNCIEDALKVPGKQMRTVWDIPNNKDAEEIRYGKNPAQKPLRLIKRMLSLSSKPGQACLVPFAGSGSECIAAKEMGLHFIGFENDPEYLKISKKRLGMLHKSTLFEENYSSNNVIEPVLKHKIENTHKQIARVVPPLIKWTGSKRSQSKIISSYIPEYNVYFEPFVGSGAVLFTRVNQPAVAGDIYEPLINLWKLVQNNPEKLIESYRQQWTLLQQKLPEYYYDVRERFNRLKDPLDLNFLLRTCVNGIVRFNEEGKFNNSFHLSRPGMSPNHFELIVHTWHNVISNVKFVCQDFAVTLQEAAKGDFVYLDPPYLGNKQRYMENVEPNRLYKVLEDLNHKEVKWAMSFDGRRGNLELAAPIPKELYYRRVLIKSGNSAVNKVLNGPIEMVEESLYLNY